MTREICSHCKLVDTCPIRRSNITACQCVHFVNADEKPIPPKPIPPKWRVIAVSNYYDLYHKFIAVSNGSYSGDDLEVFFDINNQSHITGCKHWEDLGFYLPEEFRGNG